MESLDFTTQPEVFQDFLKGQVRFGGTFGERRNILNILGQKQPHRLIDHLGDGPYCFRCLDRQGPVQIGVEIKKLDFGLEGPRNMPIFQFISSSVSRSKS